MRLNNKRYVRLKSLFHKWYNSARLDSFDAWECAHVAAMVEFSERNEPNIDCFARVSDVIQEFGEFDPWFRIDESKLKNCVAKLQMAKVLDHDGKVVSPVAPPSLFDRYMAAHDLISVCLNRRRREGGDLSKAEWYNFPITDDERDAWSYFVVPENLEVFSSLNDHMLCANSESRILLRKGFEECKVNARKLVDAEALNDLYSSGTLLTCP